MSYRWEIITHNEALKRLKADIKYRLSLIKSNCLTNNQKIAVVDFLYQHWLNSSWILKNANVCNIKYIYWKFILWRDYYKLKAQYWMVKREQKRINLFYKN